MGVNSHSFLPYNLRKMKMKHPIMNLCAHNVPLTLSLHCPPPSLFMLHHNHHCLLLLSPTRSCPDAPRGLTPPSSSPSSSSTPSPPNSLTSRTTTTTTTVMMKGGVMCEGCLLG